MRSGKGFYTRTLSRASENDSFDGDRGQNPGKIGYRAYFRVEINGNGFVQATNAPSRSNLTAESDSRATSERERSE